MVVRELSKQREFIRHHKPAELAPKLQASCKRTCSAEALPGAYVASAER